MPRRGIADPAAADWAVLQVDLSNAFNQVSRQHMLEAFVKRCPEATHWMASSYGQPAHLICGTLMLEGHCGVQQGFCFASHDIWDTFWDIFSAF